MDFSIVSVTATSEYFTEQDPFITHAVKAGTADFLYLSQQIERKWYYFDVAGLMEHGVWRKINDKWYP